MKIFISDLHLGDGSRTDDFHRDREFLEFLEFVEEKAQELIILGDLFELWQADLDRALFRHGEIVNKLLSLRNKLKITYVIGNHDYIPFIKFADLGLGISLEYRDEGSGIVGEHGHQYDIFNRYKNPLESIKWPAGQRLTLFVAGMERFIHPNADVWMKKAIAGMDDFLRKAMIVRNKITPATKEYFNRGGHFGEFEQAVDNHLLQGAKIVIFGHIHHAELQMMEKGIYANCGSWVDAAQPTYIACHRDKIELKEGLTHNIIKQLTLRQNTQEV
ncbi:MAG: UDP-2,3-diacylglucosamine diphosphatase [Candidatus Omnitrophota bacterium]|nr:MAG: UDP-2,3-diacylglucosamine diphosphatase [Candidatus Omnitrophota bacterium]